jgi:hypothetical protein
MGILVHLDCKTFQLKTCFHDAQVPFKTCFTVLLFMVSHVSEMVFVNYIIVKQII